MNNELTIYTTDNGMEITLSPDIIRNVISTDPNVTEKEVMLFLKLCESQKINPFLREAYLVKYGSSPAQIIAGKELFTKRAEAHPDYAGSKAGIIILNSNGEYVEREGTMFLAELGETMVGGWAEVYRKGYTTPIKNTVTLREYDSGKSVWASKKGTMIRKVALVQSLREAFPNVLGGLYTSEEMSINDDVLPTAPIPMEKTVNAETGEIIGVVETEEMEFDRLMKEAKTIAKKLHAQKRMAEAQAIVENIFGEGNKLTSAKPEQVELLRQAVEEMKVL